MCACPEGKEMLLVASKVKAYLKSKGMMCAADVLKAANDSLYACLDKAAERAEANGRKTVQAKDI